MDDTGSKSKFLMRDARDFYGSDGLSRAPVLVLLVPLTTGDALGACHLSILTTLSCLTDYYHDCLRSLYSGSIFGNSTGHTSPGADWNRDTIVAGTKIGMMVDFDPDDTLSL